MRFHFDQEGCCPCCDFVLLTLRQIFECMWHTCVTCLVSLSVGLTADLHQDRSARCVGTDFKLEVCGAANNVFTSFHVIVPTSFGMTTFDAGRFMLGKYFNKQKIPWKRRRRLGMAVAGNSPTATYLTKIGKMQLAGCRLCRIA